MIYLSKAIKTQSYQNSLVKYILSFLQWLWYVGIRDFMLKEVFFFFFFFNVKVLKMESTIVSR